MSKVCGTTVLHGTRYIIEGSWPAKEWYTSRMYVNERSPFLVKRREVVIMSRENSRVLFTLTESSCIINENLDQEGKQQEVFVAHFIWKEVDLRAKWALIWTKLTARRRTESLSSLWMVASSYGRRAATVSSSPFSRSLCRLLGLVGWFGRLLSRILQVQKNKNHHLWSLVPGEKKVRSRQDSNLCGQCPTDSQYLGGWFLVCRLNHSATTAVRACHKKLLWQLNSPCYLFYHCKKNKKSWKKYDRHVGVTLE